MPAASRLSLAAEYARLLIMAAESKSRGVEQSSDFQTLMNFSRLQLLASQLVKRINANPPQVSSADVERYFSEHARDFREVSFERIFLPAQAAAGSPTGVGPVDRANALRSRAMKGESLVALQGEIAKAFAGNVPANLRTGPMRCMYLSEPMRQVCDLRPGEISLVIAENSGYSICRLISINPLPFEKARDEIQATLKRQRLQAEIENVRKPISVQLDERYFGKLPAPDLAEKHGMHFPAATTTTPANEQKNKHPH
jgi:hypothetical protein